MKGVVGKDADRIVNDAYHTRDELARAIVERLDMWRPWRAIWQHTNRQQATGPTTPKHILEPSIGGGAFARACLEAWPDSTITGNDIDEDSAGLDDSHFSRVGDFLDLRLEDHALAPKQGYDLIIGNPPYKDNLHAKHLDHAISLLSPGGVVCFLLPYHFLGYTEGRGWFHDKHGAPKRMEVIQPRPSFTGKGTAATEYAAMMFGNIQPGNGFVKWKQCRWEK